MVRNEQGRHTQRIDTVDGPAIYRDDRRETYHARIAFDRRDPVLTTLLSLVSRATDRDRLDLSPLSDAVDPDALERLLTHWSRTEADEPASHLSFTYERCHVTVRASGDIVVSPQETA